MGLVLCNYIAFVHRIPNTFNEKQRANKLSVDMSLSVKAFLS